jgi:fructokinase
MKSTLELSGVSRATRILVVGEVVADLRVIGLSGGNSDLGHCDASPRLRKDTESKALSAGQMPPTDQLYVAANPGGSAANVATGLARLGVSVRFAGRLSSAGIGPWLAKHLSANGVDLSCSVEALEAPTLAMVAVDVAGVPSYSFYGADTADWQWRLDELPRADRLDVAAVHSGSLATTLPPGAEVLASWAAKVRAGGAVFISYDPNIRPSLVHDHAALVASVHSWVQRAHLVKASEEDLATLYPGTDPAVIARHWAEDGPELVVLTRGAHGSVGFRPDGSAVMVPGRQVTVVDTVGAGDAFCAGLLAWMADAGALQPGGPGQLKAEEVHAALAFADLVASATCTRHGADPPMRSDLVSIPRG